MDEVVIRSSSKNLLHRHSIVLITRIIVINKDYVIKGAITLKILKIV